MAKRPLPLTKTRAAQLAGVTERTIRLAIETGRIKAVRIAEGTDGAVLEGVAADFLDRWQPHPEHAGRRGRAPSSASCG